MSEIINSAVIKVEIDAAGVEVGLRNINEGAAKTGKSLENLGRSDGLSRLGAGADGSATQITGASKKIAASIERQISSMELGKKGTAEYYAALANQKGINPAALKPYLDQLDAVTRKTALAAEAQRKADDGAKFIEGLRARNAELGKSASELATMRAAQLGVSDTAGPMIERLRAAEEAAGGLGGSLGVASGALASFAAGLVGALSIGAFVAGVSEAIHTLAELDDMAQKSGSSVETLSRLQKVAQMTGQDFGQVNDAINKLAKGMGGLDEDSNKVTSALTRLGVSFKDSTGALRDPSQVLIETANAFQKYADGAGKTKIANDLIKGSGADLLPYLNDVSDYVSRFAGSSDEAAKNASAFGDNMGELRVRLGELGTVVAVNLLPHLIKFSEYVRDLASSEKFKKFIVDAGSAIASFAGFVATASSVLVPAFKIAAAYFAVFVGIPAVVGAVTAVLGALYGIVGKIVVGFTTGAAVTGTFNTALFGTSISANLAAGSLTKLQVAQYSLISAFAGWQIGTYLSDNFEEARIAGLSFVGAILTGWENIKYGALVTWEAISFAWDTTVGAMKSAFADFLGGVQVGLNAVGAKDTAKQVGAYVDSLRAVSSVQKTFAERTASMKAAHEAELKAIDDNVTALVGYELGLGKVAKAKEKAGTDPKKPQLGSTPDTAGASKEQSVYAALIASIREKIAANELELAGGAALSESQKASIKLDQELISGKIKLSDAHIVAARGAIAELSAVEQLNKVRLGEKNTFDFIVKSTQARIASKDALASEYALYGQSADAHEIANVALKNEAELQQYLAEQRKAGIPVTEDMLAQLRREADLHTEVGQAALAQGKALAYAAQLKTQNEKDAAESIGDPQARAKALLAIEANTWQERIRLAADGTAARKMLEAEYATWYENQSKKSYLSADVTGANELLVIMSALDDVAKSAAQGMEQAFGRVGKSIGSMTTALSGFGKAQAAITAERTKSISDARGDPKKIYEAETKASAASTTAQIRQYADMADAAQGFFDQGSKGYKVLDAASKVLHAAEVARALASIAPSMAAGAAKLFGQGGWAGFAGVAAMAAVVAGFGVAVTGGKDSGGVSAADMQKTQGTGSIYGNSDAKSESISKSLAYIEKNTYQGLEYSAGMLDALRNIEASMGGLANLILRTTGVTDGSNFGIKEGQLNAKGSPTDAISGVATQLTKALLGPGLGGAIAGFINNLWGKTTANIVDSGIKFGGSVNDLQAGRGYQQYASVDTTKSSWFGLSKSTSNSVKTQGLSDELSHQFGMIFTSLEDTLKVAATSMGIGADQVGRSLDSLVLKTTTLSLKDLKGDALTAAINGVISKAMDEISAAAFPSFEQFRQVGEGYAQTVIRLATDFQAINVVFESFGKVFGQIGVGSVAARERLIEMSGGLEKFTQQGEYFLTHFFSDQEQAAALKKRIHPTLAQYGLTTEGPDATKMFRDFVVALDTTTEAGAKAYAALQAIAPAFTDIVKASSAALDERKSIQDQLDELTMTSAQLLEKQRNALDASNRALFDQVRAATAAKAAQDAAKTSLSDVISKMKSFGDSAKSLRDGLLTGGLSTLTPQQQYEETKRQYQTTLTAAKGGDAAAQSSFSSIATAFLTASQKINGGDATYSSDFAGVLQTSDEIAKWSANQIDVAQASLDALNAQVIGISDLNTTMLGVVQAVNALPAALAQPTTFAGPLIYSNMGTSDMAPLVEEIKSLRAEVASLRADQATQTGDLIGANAQIAARSDAAIVEGVGGAFKVRSTAHNSAVALA